MLDVKIRVLLALICSKSLKYIVTYCSTSCHLLSLFVPLVISFHSLSFVFTLCTTHCQSLSFVVIPPDGPHVCLFIKDRFDILSFTRISLHYVFSKFTFKYSSFYKLYVQLTWGNFSNFSNHLINVNS